MSCHCRHQCRFAAGVDLSGNPLERQIKRRLDIQYSISILEEFDISHTNAGFQDFFRRIDHHKQELDLPVAVAMEGFNGYARPLDRLIQEQVITNCAACEVLFRIVDDVVGSKRFNQIRILRAAHASHFRTQCGGDLDGKCADASGCAVDQHLLSGLNLAQVTQPDERGLCGHGNGCCSFVGDGRWLDRELCFCDTDVFSVGAVHGPRIAQQLLRDKILREALRFLDVLDSSRRSRVAAHEEDMPVTLACPKAYKDIQANRKDA